MSAPDDPLARNGERNAAWLALQDYAAMGPGRSLEKLVQSWADSGPTKHLSVVKGWSARYHWQARVAAYDEQQARQDRAAREAIRAKRRAELEEADWSAGRQLRNRCEEILKALPNFLKRTETQIDGMTIITLALSVGPGEVARALEAASKIQRLSVGEATEIVQVREQMATALLSELQAKLSAEVYAAIVGALSGNEE